MRYDVEDVFLETLQLETGVGLLRVDALINLEEILVAFLLFDLLFCCEAGLPFQCLDSARVLSGDVLGDLLLELEVGCALEEVC